MPIKNALVVDDSMSARVMLRRMLEQKKVAVDLAETAEDALTYLQSKRPDVVFMDHILPGMNGFDATKEISANPKTAMIPVIMYTSKEGNEYLEQARAHGASGILRKPAKPAALAQILTELDRLPAAPPPSAEVPAEEMPVAAAATQEPAPVALPTVEIENIARRIAQIVVGEAVRAAVVESLDEHLASLRQDLLTRGKNAAKDVATEVFTVRSPDLSNQLRRYVNDQIGDLRATLEASRGLDPAIVEEVKQAAMTTVTETAAEVATETAKSVARLAAQNAAENSAGVVARQVANELFGARSTELVHQMQRHIHEQVGEIRTNIEQLRALNPALAQEVKALARAVANQVGAESAAQTADRIARQSAQEIAEQAGELAGRRAAERAVGAVRGAITRVYVVGGGVLVVLGAAALLYLMMRG